MAWFRVYTDIVRDPKIRRLSMDTRWLWVTLMAVAKESEAGGRLMIVPDVPASDEDIADAAGLDLQRCCNGLATLQQLLMIRKDADCYIVINWEKRQFLSDTSTERSRKSRAKLKIDECNGDATLQERCGNGDATVPENRIQNNPPISPRKRGEADVDACARRAFAEGFWPEYPRKVAKQAALKAFVKVCRSDADYHAIMAGLRAYRQTEQWQRGDAKYIPHASTWLNGRRWEDEIFVTEGSPPSANGHAKGPRLIRREDGRLYDPVTHDAYDSLAMMEARYGRLSNHDHLAAWEREMLGEAQQ